MKNKRQDSSLSNPGYFTTLHMPLLQGRAWDQTEVAHSAPMVLVNETFVRRYYSERRNFRTFVENSHP